MITANTESSLANVDIIGYGIMVISIILAY